MLKGKCNIGYKEKGRIVKTTEINSFDLNVSENQNEIVLD
jgi:hypothetical protein